MPSQAATVPENSTDQPRPIAPKWLVGLLCIAALAAGVTVARAVRSHGVTTVTGRLEAARVYLRSPIDGTVVQTTVQVGDSVKPGAVVATLRSTPKVPEDELRSSLARVTQDRAVALARYEVELGDRTRRFDDEIHALDMKIAKLEGDQYAAEMERVAWRDALDGTQVQAVGYSASVLDQDRVVRVFDELDRPQLGLTEDGRFRALISYEQAAAKAEACERQVDLCTGRRDDLIKQKDAIAGQLRKTVGLDTLDTTQQRIEAALATFEAETELESPAYGTVIAVSEMNDLCAERSVLVELADNARRRIAAEIPSSVAAECQLGDTVELLFPTGDKCLGRLAFVAPDGAGDDSVAILIDPTGKRWPRLSLGCDVSVSIR